MKGNEEGVTGELQATRSPWQPYRVSVSRQHLTGSQAATTVGRTTGGLARRQGETLQETLGSWMKYTGPLGGQCAAFTIFY